MALEWTLETETELPISFTCADGTGIEKGALLMMTDPNTVATSTGDANIIAGIAAQEKISSNGQTRIAVYTRGRFKATAGGAITVGDSLISNSSSGAANEVVTAGINAENIIGRALETASDTHTLLVELNPQTLNLA
ncbi:MAG: capsid cement protein [Gammaproteobacteria bacterium]